MTLQEKCLHVIIMENLIHRYLENKDLTCKLQLEFLRRKFSFEIAKEFYARERFHKYLDFVLNKHLKSLDTKWFLCNSWEIILNKFIEIGPSLENVSFNDAHLWDDAICHLPNILHASFDLCQDSYIQMIAKYCPKIQSIHLTNALSLSKDGLKPICVKENKVCPCPDLKKIIFEPGNHESPMLDESVGYLIRNLPFLENLEYANLPSILYSLHKDEINILDKINPYSLTKFEFYSNDIEYSNGEALAGELIEGEALDDAFKICVHLCPNLKTFSCTLDNESQLEMCSKLSKLKDLKLINSSPETIDLNKFIELRGSSLISLKVFCFSFCISHLLNNCSKLTRLRMNQIYFQRDEINAKTEMPKLVDLGFIELIPIEDELIPIEDVTDKAVVSILNASPNLQRLSFKACETALYSPGIKAAVIKVCEMNRLQFMSFIESKVQYKFVKDVLKTCSSLKTVDLSSACISECNEDLEVEYGLDVFARHLPNKPKLLFYKEHFTDFDDSENNTDVD